MSDYKHGAYGDVVQSNRIADQSAGSAFVYIGTAPIQQSAEGYKYVNRPVVCRTFAEFVKYFGYSDDWATYTLCEAAYVHLRLRGIGPIVCINVLDATPFLATALDITNGTITVALPAGSDVSRVVMGSVIVSKGDSETVPSSKYTITTNAAERKLILTETESGAFGTGTASVSLFQVADPATGITAKVIGATDGAGTNTGIWAVKNVYPLTGMIPAFLGVPGFSSEPTVHTALLEASHKINGHWDAFVYADLPLTGTGSAALSMDQAVTFKNENGYTADNEKVFFPMLAANDGNKYHLSVLAAANLQRLMAANDGIPFMTSSNTELPEAQNLWFGMKADNRVFDDDIINEKLNKRGVASAAFVGGRWVIWGAHTASYRWEENANEINVSETCTMMLYYLSNDFQARRAVDVDKPMTKNDIESLISDEQSRLDNLVKAGALTFGEVYSSDTLENLTDIMNGDHVFTFNVTTTPIAKSLTIQVNHVLDGYYTYFDIEE